MRGIGSYQKAKIGQHAEFLAQLAPTPLGLSKGFHLSSESEFGSQPFTDWQLHISLIIGPIHNYLVKYLLFGLYKGFMMSLFHISFH